MAKLKKTTIVRIEDALDIVANKIIDLENTAKRLEQIEQSIAQEVARAERINIKLNIDEFEALNERFLSDVRALNEGYLRDVRVRNGLLKPWIVVFVVLVCLVFVFGGVAYLGVYG
ncbi:MAG: hypothetical protein ACK5MI_09915 [Mangrovibacterium sp.]